MPRRTEARPLIDQMEGADADDRAAVAAAWLRIWRQQPKRSATDLHVQEFCFAVFAISRGSSGVQWSYEEIADRLRCAVSTARRVVERAAREFGIVAVVEERYARGGQAANRYRIEWSVVRAINAGMIGRSQINKPANHPSNQHGYAAPGASPVGGPPGALSEHPGARTAHPGALSEHAGAQSEHPYKESTSVLTSISTSTHSLTDPHPEPSVRAAHGGAPDPWQVVVSVLKGHGMTDVPGALTAAHGRELSPEDVLDLANRWERLRAHQPKVTIGWLHRWITGESQPPKEEKPGSPAAAPRRPRSSLMSETTRSELVRSRIVREERLAGASEEEIARRVAHALKAPPPQNQRPQHILQTLRNHE